MCPVILILLTGTLTVEYVHGDLFTDDGILIHQDGPVRTIAGIWNVLVTIEPPGPPQFDSWANELRQVITSNWTTTVITDNDKLLWMARIDDILANVDIDNEDRNNAIRLTNELTRMKRGLMPTLLKLTQFMGRATRQPSPTNGTNSSLASCISTLGRRRHRRGLLNAVGHLGKSLFGVATTDDIQALKQAIKELQAGSRVLYHNQQKFRSVFDKTRDYIEQNNDHIQDIEIEMRRLFQIASEEANRTNQLQQSFNSLVLALVDLNIQQMETVVHTFLIKKQLFHHQKVQLERGWLTEDILPSRILNFVLRQVQAQHMKTLPLVWYYQHLRVTSLWQYQQKLVYRVMIPLR